MFEGQVIALDTPGELRKLMPGDVLELDAPDERAARNALTDLPGLLSVEIFGDRLHVEVEDAKAMMNPICEHLIRRGIKVTRIEPVTPGLEDVFVSLLGHERNTHRRRDTQGRNPEPARRAGLGL